MGEREKLVEVKKGRGSEEKETGERKNGGQERK